MLSKKIANVKKLKYPLHTCIMVKDSIDKFIDMQISHQTDFLKSQWYTFSKLWHSIMVVLSNVNSKVWPTPEVFFYINL